MSRAVRCEHPPLKWPDCVYGLLLIHWFCLFCIGFSRIWGYPVGILANNGVLFSESALKVFFVGIFTDAVIRKTFWVHLKSRSNAQRKRMISWWQLRLVKPKFTLDRYVSTRRDMMDVSSASWWACRAVLVPSWQTTKMQLLLACTSLVFCALDLEQSPNNFWKQRGGLYPRQSTLWRHPWTRVVRVALVMTSVLHLAARQARHLTTLLCQNAWAR